jgi:hypothetical protein
VNGGIAGNPCVSQEAQELMLQEGMTPEEAMMEAILNHKDVKGNLGIDSDHSLGVAGILASPIVLPY